MAVQSSSRRSVDQAWSCRTWQGFLTVVVYVFPRAVLQRESVDFDRACSYACVFTLISIFERCLNAFFYFYVCLDLCSGPSLCGFLTSVHVFMFMFSFAFEITHAEGGNHLAWLEPPDANDTVDCAPRGKP